MQHIIEDLETDISTEYADQRDLKSVLLIAITSNRGLCGAFNSNVIRLTNELINEKYKNCKITLLTIGKKADDYFKKTEHYIKGTELPRNLNELLDDLTFENVMPVAEKIMKSFTNKQFDRIELVYNQFKSAGVQNLTTEQFLPITKLETGTAEVDSTVKPYFIYEPSLAYMMNELVPKIIKVQFYKALLDSNASEHGARMTAMDNATENANEMIRDLRVEYNRERQADITTELTEIVSGANAQQS